MDAPAPAPAPAEGLQPHRGTMILIFGILGILCCFIFGIFAWVWANEDLARMRRGTMDPAGRDMTNIGRILGIIAVIWAVVAALLYAMGVFTLPAMPE